MMPLVPVLLAAMLSGQQRFANVEIEKPFDRYLTADPLLMEVSGAKIIRLPDGETMLLSIAYTVLKNRSARERVRAEKVCRLKALASLAGELHGVQIVSVTRLEQQTKITVEKGREKASTLASMLELSQAKVESIVRDLPVVGHWTSDDGDVYYVAIGTVIER